MTEDGGGVRRAAVYAGGFMGPFAGGMPGVILSEIGESFGITAVATAVCIPAYMVPFASLMLFSGSIAQTVGRSRMLRLAYGSCLLSAILCAFATSWGVFLFACALAGASNAFTTPILLATLGRVLERNRLGRGLGIFSAAQAFAQLSAPGFGGLVATLDWRFAYGAIALVALLLLLVGVPPDPARGRFRPSSLLEGISWPVMRIGAAQLALGVGVIGMVFLVAIQADRAFGSGPADRGLIVMGGGVVALVAAPLAGRAVDRWGAQRVLVVALVLAGAGIGMIPLASAPWMLAAAWAVAWSAAQVGAVACNGAVLGLSNGSAGISVAQAFRFYGSALAPVVILPVFTFHASWGFWTPTVVLVALAAVIAATNRRSP